MVTGTKTSASSYACDEATEKSACSAKDLPDHHCVIAMGSVYGWKAKADTECVKATSAQCRCTNAGFEKTLSTGTRAERSLDCAADCAAAASSSSSTAAAGEGEGAAAGEGEGADAAGKAGEGSSGAIVALFLMILSMF